MEKMCNGISLLYLAGTGGIGKTPLAKEIYNHLIGNGKFKHMSFLEIDRSSPSSIEVGPSLLRRLRKQLLWDLLSVPKSSQESYKYWFDKLSSQGPVFVVLDDIHNKSLFDKFILDTSLLVPGSCIIVTSHDPHLLKTVAGGSNSYFHEVTSLGCIESKKLFNWDAFGDEDVPNSLKAIAEDVIKACGGLPLALKVVGCGLFDKIFDEDQKYIWVEEVKALKGERDVMNVLKWSYNGLSKSEQLMFLDIACVFCGWKKEEALEIWRSYEECSCCGCGTPHTSLNRLIEKSLVELEDEHFVNRAVLAMHGLLREMGQGIGRVDGSHL